MVPSLPRAAALAAMVLIFLTSIARAGQVGTADSAGSSGDPSLELPFTFDGPPVPVAPSIISRDADGRATLRAIRLSTPIKLDGQLDEAVYATTPSFTDFFQMEPVEGQVATEKTEGWLFFDEAVRPQVWVGAAVIFAACWWVGRADRHRPAEPPGLL